MSFDGVQGTPRRSALVKKYALDSLVAYGVILRVGRGDSRFGDWWNGGARYQYIGNEVLVINI